MISYIKLLRPHQYVKNLFIFAPMLFSFALATENIIATFIAFVLFSLIASSIYVLNDLMDIQEDREHPKKKTDP